jgi:two-component system, chemotaxis family, protein-glutamate methylesterase/glutaminase
MTSHVSRVLLVDDSAVVRNLISQAINAESDLEVVATAGNGEIAIRKMESVDPDIVVLDINMPVMDGLEALAAMRALRPKLPIIMFSTLTERGAEATIQALSLGATDYATKPSGAVSPTKALRQVQGELIRKIRGLSRSVQRVKVAAASAPSPDGAQHGEPTVVVPRRRTSNSLVRAVAIATSTGGPAALDVVLPAITKPLRVPMFIVQHMPPTFTGVLAKRLNQHCATTVVEATHGEPVRPGHCYIAKGGQHMVIAGESGSYQIRCTDDPPVNNCRPAADPMIDSLAARYGSGLLVVVLTGMGSDGLAGCRTAAAAGARIVAQDEASSMVWGMPGAVAKAGLADVLLPLSDVAAHIKAAVG